ncbi:hypothetical protein [Streptomyces sp. NPDC058451]|uniref:hypothetical protein n=1 Tax=Streptomyces sp. NPDC058451 TaxID=3346506 RepID=UPI00364C9B50
MPGSTSAAAIGTVTKNTQRRLRYWVSTPPAGRPVENPTALWTRGRATFTMVASSTTMSCATAITARAMPLR